MIANITTELIKEYVDKARGIDHWTPEDGSNYTILQKAVMAAIALQSVKKLWNSGAKSYAAININDYTLAMYGSLLDVDKMLNLYKVIADKSDIDIQVRRENLPYPQTKDVYRYIEVLEEMEKLK